MGERVSIRLKDLKKPMPSWKPDYSVIVVTENEKTYTRLSELGCPVKLLISDRDVIDLQTADIIQIIDVDDYSRPLEDLHQSFFLKDISEAYLERHLTELSGWKDNIQIIEKNTKDSEILGIIEELKPLLEIIENNASKVFSKDHMEKAIAEINSKVSEELKNLMISGEKLMKMLSEKIIPEEIKDIVNIEIKKSSMPRNLFKYGVPLEIDEEEFEKYTRNNEMDNYTKIAKRIIENSKDIMRIPSMLKKLSDALVLLDFKGGILKFIKGKDDYPVISNDLYLKESHNTLISNPKPITFFLDEESKCSILTGANSGGKTTLLEHIIQNIIATSIGLPLKGEYRMPLFSEVYYFAKNKGSLNKGAFETLLTQMSEIIAGKKTLILADEIESVTEPGVAGKMISATAEDFAGKGCFMVIATHLGQEIQKSIPKSTRIDGIEAKGLDENNELIVDHNPKIGKLANSTPELIVEKMANTSRSEYFTHLNAFLKNKK